MPIRKDNQDLYPENWREISLLIRESNLYVCQECGVQCRRPGDAYDHTLPELTCAHWFHDYHGAEIFLAALCSRCHLRHDRPLHATIRRRRLRLRRRQAGQLQLLHTPPSRLSASDMRELEAHWPGAEYLESLGDGADLFAQFEVTGA